MAVLDNLVRSAAAYPALAGVIEGRVAGHAFLIDARNLAVARHFARHLALGLGCRSAGPRPCGTCDPCKQPRTPYFNELIPMGVEFRIQQIHALIEECGLALEPGARRVYILCGAEWMNDESANAFLKVLEEPPSAVAFLLATGSVRQVLPTIRSRCHPLHVEFPPVSALLQGPLAGSPVPPHWLHAALEIWGRTPGLLESAARPSAPVSSRGLPGLETVLAHYQKRSAASMAEPVEGIFSDLPHALDTAGFFLGSLSRTLGAGDVLSALRECSVILEWLDGLREGVEKGLHGLEAERRKTYGPSYVHPLLEEDSYEKSYYRRVNYQALEAFFRAILLLARAAIGTGSPYEADQLEKLSAEVPALSLVSKCGPIWGRQALQAVESARAQLYSVVAPRFALEAVFLKLAGAPPVPATTAAAAAETRRI